MPPDPFRTLGLPRGASLDEVKRAYRRLAKANHPDRAGEGSLARFLEIQDAYQRIVGAGEGTGAAGPGGRRGGGAGTGPRRPWDADPTRADATRRAYGSRTRRPRPGPGGPTPGGPGAGGPTDGAAAGPDPAAPGGTTPGSGDHPGGSRRAGRGRNKATLGSTSYDGADEGPFEPDWGGASWYGTTTGTYWTLNPKEYADPRKHGPEYQARARRAAAAGSPAVEPGAEPASPGSASAAPDAGTAGGAARPSYGPRHTTTSWWAATSGGAAGADQGESADADRTGPTRQAPRPSAVPPVDRPGSSRGPAARPTGEKDPLLPAFDASRWLESGRGGIPARVGRAVLGWAPIALGIGWLAGEVTGCGRYSADCDAAIAPLAWLAQVAILALLLLVPRLGSAATLASLVTLAAAVPGALILSASGTDAADTMAPLALGGLLIVGWVVGIVAGVVREIRALRGPTRSPGSDGGPAPVS